MSIYVKVLIGCCLLFLLSVGLCGIALTAGTSTGESVGIFGILGILLSILGIVGTGVAKLISVVAGSGAPKVTPPPELTDKPHDE